MGRLRSDFLNPLPFYILSKFLTLALSYTLTLTLFNEGKDIDYWSPSSFHNGPPQFKNNTPFTCLEHSDCVPFPNLWNKINDFGIK